MEYIFLSLYGVEFFARGFFFNDFYVQSIRV